MIQLEYEMDVAALRYSDIPARIVNLEAKQQSRSKDCFHVDRIALSRILAKGSGDRLAGTARSQTFCCRLLRERGKAGCDCVIRVLVSKSNSLNIPATTYNLLSLR